MKNQHKSIDLFRDVKSWKNQIGAAAVRSKRATSHDSLNNKKIHEYS